MYVYVLYDTGQSRASWLTAAFRLQTAGRNHAGAPWRSQQSIFARIQRAVEELAEEAEKSSYWLWLRKKETSQSGQLQEVGGKRRLLATVPHIGTCSRLVAKQEVWQAKMLSRKLSHLFLSWISKRHKVWGVCEWVGVQLGHSHNLPFDLSVETERWDDL